MMPYFSIIIPVYNVAPYLRKCLDSVLDQTFTDWEAICVDDGSTDGSGSILDEYAAKDSRFRVFHQINAGVEVARNIGYSFVRGERIIFMDGDDAIQPKYLSSHRIAIALQPQNTVTYSAHIAVYGDSRFDDCSSVYKDCSSTRDLCFSMLKDGWSPIIHGWVWPREILAKGGGWRLDIIANDDFEFSMRHLKLGERVFYVRESSAIYTQHSNGLSHMSHNHSYYESIINAATARENFALDIENSEAMKTAVAQMWYRLLLSPDFVCESICRQYIWSRLKRLGLPKCSCVRPSSKQELVLKWLGVRGLLVSLMIHSLYCKKLSRYIGKCK